MKKQPGSWLERILNIDRVMAVICMSVLIIVTFLGSVMRYFFNSPFVWQEEVQIWMIIWTVFFGGSYAFRKGGHVTIEILVDAFPPKLQKAVEWFAYLCATAALIFVCYNSIRLNIQFYNTNKITSVLRIPSYKIYWAVAFGSIWMIISNTLYTVRKLVYGIGGGDKEEAR